MPSDSLLPAPSTDPDPDGEARQALWTVLHETKRVILGQDPLLERVLVALLAGGHVLLEGVPGLAKTLTVRSLAEALGGSFSRVQFTPDLVPADIVGTRIWQPDRGEMHTELGPVFANLLLADEINRAPAKVQSALLEVMQEHQVTIGGRSYRVPQPFLVLATQNPIESEGTYRLPEAQVDRFLFKLVVEYPEVSDEVDIARGALGRTTIRQVLSMAELEAHRERAQAVHVDRDVAAYAVALVDATRFPERHGLAELAPLVRFGASPRASIGLLQSAQALALLRGRTFATAADIADLAPDVLRHRLVLTYDALADGEQPDAILARILAAVRRPDTRHLVTGAA